MVAEFNQEGGSPPTFMAKTREDRKQDMINKLRREALNRLQLRDELYFHQNTIDEYIRELHKEKRIYVAFWGRTGGRFSPYYLSGEGFDAPQPKQISAKEREAKCRERKLHEGSSASTINNEHLITGCFASMIRNTNMSP